MKDPKRASVLAGLAVVMLVLWARVLLNGPASATASLIRRSVAAITDSPTPSVRAQSSNPVLDWLAQPKRPVERNLFAIKLDDLNILRRNIHVPKSLYRLIGIDAV